MADGQVAPFPALAPGGIRAAIDAVFVTKQNLEKAEADLCRERATKHSDKITAFLASTKTAVSPAEAVKMRLELDALRKTFDDQDAAIKFWQQAIDDRFAALAERSRPDVVTALTEHIALLKERQASQQGGVDQFKLLIAEFNAWLEFVTGADQKQRAPAAKSASKTKTKKTKKTK